MDSDATLKTIKHRFLEMAACARDAGNMENGHESLYLQCLRTLLDIGQSIAIHTVQVRHEHELMMRDGMVAGNSAKFAWKDPRTGMRRTANVYPNAHNKGETFGLETWEISHLHHRRETFHGASWTYEDAFSAAKEWVNNGIVPVNPENIVREIIER